jgi:hypothetical protein
MKISEILIAARAKIADEAAWTQGEFTRDAKGYAAWNYREACSFCSLGAIQVVAPPSVIAWDVNSIGPSGPIQYLVEAIPQEFIEDIRVRDETDFLHGFVAQYNDKHTHKDVLAMYDRAIEAALEDEGK